jgi:hypothetical protein
MEDLLQFDVPILHLQIGPVFPLVCDFCKTALYKIMSLKTAVLIVIETSLNHYIVNVITC